MPVREFECQNDRCKLDGYTIEVFQQMDDQPPACDECGARTVQVFRTPTAMSMGKWIFHNPRPNPEEL